jgi:S-adenosylmethionine synthetase
MYLFTSETVSAGHPDKCADIIADSIVDALLQIDSSSRIATEVFIAGKNLFIGGEVKTSADVNKKFYEDIAKKALIDIGYDGKSGFGRSETLYPDDLKITVCIHRQSKDISIGVDQKTGELGAGDQGIMFGYATEETPLYMPSAFVYARKIRDMLYFYAKKHPKEFGVDIKTQVSVDYITKENFDNCLPQKIAKIVIAIPHVKEMDIESVRFRIKELVAKKASLPCKLFDPKTTEFFIDQTGRYVSHSPLSDSGLTGRKVVADTYGGYAPVGGGSQSSKDYSKVDRSALYAARWLAKHIVASGIAKKAQIQLSYVIGRAKPLSVTLDTLHTNKIDISDEVLSVKIAEKFPLTPKWITEKFGLDKPKKERFLYADIAAAGQIGYEHYPWEKLDELEWFKKLQV